LNTPSGCAHPRAGEFGNLLLRADRRVPFRFLAPVLIACRRPALRVGCLCILRHESDSLFPSSLECGLYPVELTDPVVRLHLREGPDPPPGAADIFEALALRSPREGDALLVVDDDVPLERVAEAAAACLARGFCLAIHVPGDLEPWVADPPASVSIDGVPVRAARK
jgi:hypothetical protein